jgi:hypothetical protein
MRESFSCSSPGSSHSPDGEGKFDVKFDGKGDGKGEGKGEWKSDGKGEWKSDGKGEWKSDGMGEKCMKENEKDLQGAISKALNNNIGGNGTYALYYSN